MYFRSLLPCIRIANIFYPFEIFQPFSVSKTAVPLFKGYGYACRPSDSRTELELYLEYYNHNRIKVKLKGLSPV
ncbi:MAG: IS3 family transposase [Candidatus Gastranaerophilaceae bacterium]